MCMAYKNLWYDIYIKKSISDSVIFALEMLLKKKKEKKEKVVNTNYEREGRGTKDISVIWKNKI